MHANIKLVLGFLLVVSIDYFLSIPDTTSISSRKLFESLRTLLNPKA
jgi:hypothetical protein